jgi:prephenate dehydrogenase
MASDREAQADDGPFRHIAVVGFGLIGASIALAVRRRWAAVEITAIDRPEVVASALRTGAADAGGDSPALCGGADLVILAAPVQTNIRIVGELPSEMSGTAVITDVSSTKRRIAEAAQRLPERLPFVGGHPLAGASTGGLDAARADLFVGHPWILTPIDDRAAAVDRLSHFIEALGARVLRMNPEGHDRSVAYLSHLPQLVASALMQVVGEATREAGLALAGGGLRDTTRLATSPADIWRDIASTNCDNIGHAIDEVIQVLSRMKPDSPASSDALASTFESAAHWKRVLDSTRGSA